MKPNTPWSLVINCVLVVALVGALTWIWALTRQLNSHVESSARLASQLNIERNRAINAERRLAETRLPMADAAAKTVLPTEESSVRRSRDFPGGMMDNPAMQSMLAGGIKSGLDQRYAALFRKLKLEPARLEHLKQLLTERGMSSLDIIRAAQMEGLGNAEISALLSASSSEADADIRAMLGDQEYAQFQDYEQNIEAYGLLDNVERRLGFTDTPLTEKQSEEVLRIIAETSDTSLPPGMSDNPMVRVMQGMGGGPSMIGSLGQARITDQTIEAATPVLGESQVEVLKQIQIEQQSQRNAMSAMGGPFRRQ